VSAYRIKRIIRKGSEIVAVKKFSILAKAEFWHSFDLTSVTLLAVNKHTTT
jgi:hypothetical protein